MAPTPPCPTARSVSSKIRFLSSALNLRRSGLTGTSGSGELVTKGTAILVSLTMILLAALLCNYGRGKCLIIIGTEGVRPGPALVDDVGNFLRDVKTPAVGPPVFKPLCQLVAGVVVCDVEV